MSVLVLLVEDEIDLATALAYSLRAEGFETTTAPDGRSALARVRVDPRPDVVLLDLMLPDISGTEVCRRLKADPQTAGLPVVMVTARDEEIDRVIGFEVGADDYVAKPFSTRELVLRLRAVLRRVYAPPPAAREAFGVLRIDEAGHRVWVGGAEVALTALEFRLLCHLVERRGRVQTRDQLIDHVWGDEAAVEARTVDGQVKRLRQKLGAAGAYIETRRGAGYCFHAGGTA